MASDINPHIIEALYAEGMVLADEVRSAFDLSGRLDAATQDEDLTRIAISCEALRTTTRMMHVIAWLLNQRAFFAGEISEFQLRRHGRLPSAPSNNDPEQLNLIDHEMLDLIERTKAFYRRVERLDQAWRDHFEMRPAAIHRLRQRLGEAVARL
jgi:regulator of CtrA degradation